MTGLALEGVRRVAAAAAAAAAAGVSSMTSLHAQRRRRPEQDQQRMGGQGVRDGQDAGALGRRDLAAAAATATADDNTARYIGRLSTSWA